MKKLFLLFALLLGCHSAEVTKFDDHSYPPTKKIEVFSDLSTIKHKYVEIGYVEAKGGMTVSKQALLDDMKEQAMQEGANALIKVEFSDRTHYSPSKGSTEKPEAKAVMIRYVTK